jgi:hypothetical protein
VAVEAAGGRRGPLRLGRPPGLGEQCGRGGRGTALDVRDPRRDRALDVHAGRRRPAEFPPAREGIGERPGVEMPRRRLAHRDDPLVQPRRLCAADALDGVVERLRERRPVGLEEDLARRGGRPEIELHAPCPESLEIGARLEQRFVDQAEVVLRLRAHGAGIGIVGNRLEQRPGAGVVLSAVEIQRVVHPAFGACDRRGRAVAAEREREGDRDARRHREPDEGAHQAASAGRRASLRDRGRGPGRRGLLRRRGRRRGLGFGGRLLRGLDVVDDPRLAELEHVARPQAHLVDLEPVHARRMSAAQVLHDVAAVGQRREQALLGADVLALDPQITGLPRTDADRAVHERRLEDVAGDFDADGHGGGLPDDAPGAGPGGPGRGIASGTGPAPSAQIVRAAGGTRHG